MSDDRAQLNELGFYVLAGAPQSPAELLDEIPAGEALGFGSTFISERFNIKEAVTLSGAVAAASRTLGIATAATNHNTRHPIVTASYATTMHRLTGGRFTLGLGRGIESMFGAFGIPRDHHRPTRGLRRIDAPAVPRRGRDGPRRTGRQVPGAHARFEVRRGHPDRVRRVRAELARARRPGHGHGGAPHVLHRRDDAALRRHGAPGRRAGGARPVGGAHLVVLRHGAPTISRTTCG